MTTAEELQRQLDQLKEALEESDLSSGELEVLGQEIDRLLALVPQQRGGHSITELKGLGKEFWRSVDVEKYIREERDSWR
jgi:hypothetical protein